MRKEFNPDTRRCLVYVAAVSLFWNTNITDVIRKRSIGYFRVALQSFCSVHTVRNDNTLHPLYLMSSINCIVYPTGETTELRSVSFSIFPWCVWRILVGVYHHDYGGVSACAISNNFWERPSKTDDKNDSQRLFNRCRRLQTFLIMFDLHSPLDGLCKRKKADRKTGVWSLVTNGLTCIQHSEYNKIQFVYKQ